MFRAVHALLALKPACLDALRAEGWEQTDLLSASARLDEATGWLVSRLAERYAARVELASADQLQRLREREEQLLAQTSELAAGRRELEARIREVAALNQSAVALNSSLDLDRVLQLIVARASELMGTGLCALFEWDEEAQRLRGRTAVGLRSETLFQIAGAVSVEPGLVRRVIEERRSLAISDLGDASGRLPTAALAAVHDLGVRAALAMPLVSHGRFLGYLATYYRTPHDFAEHRASAFWSPIDRPDSRPLVPGRIGPSPDASGVFRRENQGEDDLR